MRAGGYKFAYDAENPKVPAELYDLNADPGETKNLAAALPQKVAELKSLIESHQTQTETAAVALTDDMSDTEMAGLAEHLRKLGYVE